MSERRPGDRAVSFSLGYALTLAIIAVLFSVLLVGSAGVLEGQTERTVENELEIIGQQVASDIASADRLVRADDGADPDRLEIRMRLPEVTAGASYTVTVDGGELRMESTNPDAVVTVPFQSELDVEGTVGGGSARIEYNNDQLELVSE